MPIQYDDTPDTILTPGVFHEISASPSGTPPPDPQRLLVIGTVLAAGTWGDGELHKIGSLEAAEEGAGIGSMLAGELIAARRGNPNCELYAVSLVEATGTQSTGDVTFTGTATAAGAIPIYVGGQLISVPIAVGDTAAAVATAAVAIAADADHKRLNVTAADGTGSIDFTCKWDGVTGDYIGILVAPHDDEKVPAGLTATPTAMSGGATDPDVNDAIAAFDDTQYHKVVMPYTDTTNLTALDVEMESRWTSQVDKSGLVFAAFWGTHAASVSAASAQNKRLLSYWAPGKTMAPPWEVAATIAAVGTAITQADRSQGWKGRKLPHVSVPDRAGRFIRSERQALLEAGASTVTVQNDGSCLVSRPVTTYKTNALAQTDRSYFDVTTMTNLIGWRHGANAIFGQFVGTYKQVADGTRVAQGVKAVTPSSFVTMWLAYFQDQEALGHVEGYDQFKDALLVEINPSDPNMMDHAAFPNLSNVNQVNRIASRFIR